LTKLTFYDTMIARAKKTFEGANMELKPRTFTITLNREAARRQAKSGTTVSISEVLRDILDRYAKSKTNGKEEANVSH